MQPIEECSGLCPSQERNSLIMENGLLFRTSSCLCCKPAETYNQTIAMDCLIDSTNNVYAKQEVTYMRIKSCDCKECKENF